MRSRTIPYSFTCLTAGDKKKNTPWGIFDSRNKRSDTKDRDARERNRRNGDGKERGIKKFKGETRGFGKASSTNLTNIADVIRFGLNVLSNDAEQDNGK